MNIRIGHGYDVHRTTDGNHIVLGGVRIEHTCGLLAHSDGDVLLHALMDALLGAAGLGDIGHWFPDTDDAFRGADSRGLLKQVKAELAKSEWCVGNVDITLVAEAPKVAPFLAAIRINIAEDLCIEPSQVNIKATTTEGLGMMGRREGIACHAVALINRS